MSSVLCYPQLFKTHNLIINLVYEWLVDGFCIRFWCCFYLLKTLIICLYHAIMSAYKHIYFASIQTLVLIPKPPKKSGILSSNHWFSIDYTNSSSSPLFIEIFGGWLRKTKNSLNVPYLIYHTAVNMSSEKPKKA